ncbi:MAG: ankyrin repeat domain-containing protein [Phycisphaerales bacterium]|jgi:ankyrin repeat protein
MMKSNGKCQIIKPERDIMIPVGDREVVELLIASGADVNIETNRGQTPLDIAERLGNTEIVEILTKAAEEQTTTEKNP